MSSNPLCAMPFPFGFHEDHDSPVLSISGIDEAQRGGDLAAFQCIGSSYF